MADAVSALAALRDHFAKVTDEQYRHAVRKFSPELIEGGVMAEDATLAQLGLPGLETQESSAIVPFRSKPAYTPLSAYLACALTGLSDVQRQLMFQLSDTVAVIADELSIDLYEPRKKTDPVHHASVPDRDVFHIDRERVVRSDLLVYLAHYPSTGAGEELDFAYNAMVPIVIVTHSGARVSRMVTGIPGLVLTVSYEEPEELRAVLRETLEELRPRLVQRKLAFSDYDVNIVGDRLRRLREGLGLTREDLAAVTSNRFAIDSDSLSRMEASSDRDSNPSLLQLRELAAALNTTVADLVEPDLEQIILSTLGSWVGNREAARLNRISTRDRNRLLRRLLLRLIDNLEDEE